MLGLFVQPARLHHPPATHLRRLLILIVWTTACLRTLSPPEHETVPTPPGPDFTPSAAPVRSPLLVGRPPIRRKPVLIWLLHD